MEFFCRGEHEKHFHEGEGGVKKNCSWCQGAHIRESFQTKPNPERLDGPRRIGRQGYPFASDWGVPGRNRTAGSGERLPFCTPALCTPTNQHGDRPPPQRPNRSKEDDHHSPRPSFFGPTGDGLLVGSKGKEHVHPQHSLEKFTVYTTISHPCLMFFGSGGNAGVAPPG